MGGLSVSRLTTPPTSPSVISLRKLVEVREGPVPPLLLPKTLSRNSPL